MPSFLQTWWRQTLWRLRASSRKANHRGGFFIIFMRIYEDQRSLFIFAQNMKRQPVE